MCKEGCRFYSNVVARGIALVSCALFLCDGDLAERPVMRPLQFGVFDVGEGLSQIVKATSGAVLFDAGPQDGYKKWNEAYVEMGSPFIAAIVISHDHEDHYGGLSMLDSCFNWSGLMVASPYQDTAFLRSLVPSWNQRLRFKIVAENDTLALLGGVTLRCLWPPFSADIQNSFNESLANRYSLVFIIKHGDAAALITSDIDSLAEKALSLEKKAELRADLFIIPHHGSGGSLDPVFYGYVHPSIAVISYGVPNDHGHPSPSVIAWLSQMGVNVRMTALDGICLFESNGYYWRERR